MSTTPLSDINFFFQKMCKTLHSPPFGKICIYSAESIGNDVLQDCAALFTGHYGKWGSMGVKPGQPVKLSLDRLRRDYLFNNETCFLVTAESKKSNQLIGHAFACRFPFGHGFAVWITQLVVHSNFRNHGLATELLSKCCLSADNIAWGICSSHPHAVRALVKITKRKFDTQKIGKNAIALIEKSCIPYFQNCNVDVTSNRSVIHTNFYIDHSEVNKLLEEYVKEGKWNLGTLDEGDEFFAFTFDESI